MAPSQPKDTADGFMKNAKTFTKKNVKINIIIIGMLPQDKTYSFRRTTIDGTNKILVGECKNFQQIRFK